MSDTPIYDVLRAEYDMREIFRKIAESIKSAWAKIREVVRNAMDTISKALASQPKKRFALETTNMVYPTSNPTWNRGRR